MWNECVKMKGDITRVINLGDQKVRRNGHEGRRRAGAVRLRDDGTFAGEQTEI